MIIRKGETKWHLGETTVASKTRKGRTSWRNNLFPPIEDGMSREERIRVIKRIVSKGKYITEEKLEAAIEQLIDDIVF